MEEAVGIRDTRYWVAMYLVRSSGLYKPLYENTSVLPTMNHYDTHFDSIPYAALEQHLDVAVIRKHYVSSVYFTGCLRTTFAHRLEVSAVVGTMWYYIWSNSTEYIGSRLHMVV